MKNSYLLKFFIFLLITLGCVVLFNSKIGDVPPLGKFLNPFNGFWQNADNADQPAKTSLTKADLKEDVDILIDEQGIPHIFAKNEHDLYYAQGYITAKDRLWQMDFQTRFASGRLAEVVGEKAVELDRYQRRMGMVFGAEAMLREGMSDPKSRLLMEAYTKGVNAYISNLSPKDYPIEFKILDYKPEAWTPLNTALLLKLMSATLARGTDELAMTNILERFGKDVINDLFPNYPHKEDPIIPKGTVWEIKSDKFEKPSVSFPTITNVTSGNLRKGSLNLSSKLLTSEKPENQGSNNWAIAGNRSSTGYPILANDPHLDLTLPSIWYQIQLHAPGINVYGVSIPGAPSVIIGFNKDVAWGVTNVGSDVLDWYKIDFKDNKYHEYLFDGVWKKTQIKVEQIAVRGKEMILDTVYYTHHGPVSYTQHTKKAGFGMARNIPENYALKWVAHLPSNELKTFYILNRAKNYDDYRRALFHYIAPAQNFVFADRKGDIAITSNGLFPLKEKRQGKFLLNGSDPTDEWKKRIPFVDNPKIRNPERGYVSSANQWPVDPTYPYYLGWEFAPYERAHRINTQLDTMREASLSSFNALQNDNYSIFAENVIDTLRNIVKNAKGLDSIETKSLKLLDSWDNRFEANSKAASIFEIWTKKISDLIWRDKFSDRKVFMRYPSRDRTVHLFLNEPHSHWFSTKLKKQTRNDIIITSYKETIHQLENDYGDQQYWEWSLVKKTHVPHLASIGGFGSRYLKVGGVKHAVNAMSEKNGPSWRMVVMLGETPKAYGIIPGGQSGNPGSKFYDNQIPIWEKGELNELLFLEDNKPGQKGIVGRIEIKKH